MTWIAAGASGAALGLVYFGGLWLTVAGVVRRPSRVGWIPISGLVRFSILGLGLAALSRSGAGGLLAALSGLWLSRWYLLRRLGGLKNGG